MTMHRLFLIKKEDSWLICSVDGAVCVIGDNIDSTFNGEEMPELFVDDEFIKVQVISSATLTE